MQSRVNNKELKDLSVSALKDVLSDELKKLDDEKYELDLIKEEEKQLKKVLISEVKKTRVKQANLKKSKLKAQKLVSKEKALAYVEYLKKMRTSEGIIESMSNMKID